MTTHTHQQEFVILVDEQDQETGFAEKMAAHQANQLHRAFSVFIFKQVSAGAPAELLLQQRAEDKYHCPGLWTNTCCSHPRPGESTLAAGERRLNEEFGIQTPLTNLGSFIYNAHFSNGLSEHEVDHVLIGSIDANTTISPNPEEIAAYRWVTFDQLKHELETHPEQFTPWFSQALSVIEKKRGFDNDHCTGRSGDTGRLTDSN